MRSLWGSAIQTLVIKCKVILGLQPICLSRHTLAIEYCLICGLGALQNALHHDLTIVHRGLLLLTMWTHYLEVLVTGSPVSAPSHITCPHYTQQSVFLTSGWCRSRRVVQVLVSEACGGVCRGLCTDGLALSQQTEEGSSLSASAHCAPWLRCLDQSSILSPGANVPPSTTDALWVAEEDLERRVDPWESLNCWINHPWSHPTSRPLVSKIIIHFFFYLSQF